MPNYPWRPAFRTHPFLPTISSPTTQVGTPRKAAALRVLIGWPHSIRRTGNRWKAWSSRQEGDPKGAFRNAEGGSPGGCWEEGSWGSSALGGKAAPRLTGTPVPITNFPSLAVSESPGSRLQTVCASLCQPVHFALPSYCALGRKSFLALEGEKEKKNKKNNDKNK